MIYNYIIIKNVYIKCFVYFLSKTLIRATELAHSVKLIEQISCKKSKNQ